MYCQNHITNNNVEDECETRGVSHLGLVIYIEKYLQGKKRFMETQIFHHAKM
jgi:hypothetical protein